MVVDQVRHVLHLLAPLERPAYSPEPCRQNSQDGPRTHSNDDALSPLSPARSFAVSHAPHRTTSPPPDYSGRSDLLYERIGRCFDGRTAPGRFSSSRSIALNQGWDSGWFPRGSSASSTFSGAARREPPRGPARSSRDARPASGAAAVSGSMLLRRSPVLPPFVIHVKPVDVPQPDYGARHVAALVLIVEPWAPASCRSRPGRQDPGADAAVDSGGGLVGGRQERARHGPGARTHGTRHLLASEADLPEAVHLTAGGPSAVGAVARRTRMRGGAAGVSPAPPPRGRRTHA